MTRCKVCPWYGPDNVAWLHAWRHLSPDCRIPTASYPGGTQAPAPTGTEGGTGARPVGSSAPSPDRESA